MASVEEDFPRGGTNKTTTESKIVVQRAEVDNLFQSNEKPETKKRKGVSKDDGKKGKKPKTDTESEDGLRGLRLNSQAKCIEILHSKNLKEGMLILGCVKDVADFEVTVGLPCGMQGFLSIRNISDSYTKLLSEQLDSDNSEEICSLPHLFHPGMLLRCVVAKLDVARGGTLSIQLSVNPKLVNKALTSSALRAGMVLSGFVESIEDHGCLIDLGIGGTKAFLLKTAIKDKRLNPEDLKVGQYVMSQVEEVKNNGRVVQLTITSPTAAPVCAEVQQGWTLTNLLPGLLVKATIKKVTKHGLLLDFLSSFSGQVDFLHMEADQESGYTEEDQVQACVLYVEPSTRVVGLSLRSYLLQPGTPVNTTPPAGDSIGKVLTSCKLTSMHFHSGAMLELPDKTVAFVHRNHLKESSESTNENKPKAMSEHTCRIMDFSPMEQIHIATLRKSIIDKPFYRYHDLHAGELVEGTVSVLLNHGMIVHVSGHIRGLVPRTHLSDIILKNPEKKYIEGMKVKCRVLTVDPDNKKLCLSRKKALVESTLPQFVSFKDARPGRISHGFIVCVKKFGCIVRFYNNVKGLVPVSELSSEPVSSPDELFYVGQVLKVKVLQCDPEREKLILSFKAAVEGGSEEPPKPQIECEVGTIVEAKVLKKTTTSLEVAILPDEVRAVLPTMHLSDHMSNCALLWEGLQEGDAMSDLMCFSNKKDIISLTKKPTVRWSLEEGVVAKEFSEIIVGMQLVGWITSIMSYGVFVEFPYGLFGLSPKAAMTDKFLTDTAKAFEVGQTVLAKVTDLDEDKKRFLVTLKMSEVIPPQGDIQTRLINGLQERRAVGEMFAVRENSDLRQQLAALSIGQKLKLTVCTADNGATFKSDDLAGATIQASKHHVLGSKLTPGQKVTAAVLHVDILSTCVQVSILCKLLQKKKSLTETKYTAMVQHVEQDFAVVSLQDTAQMTVIQTRSHLNHVFLTENEKLKAGMTLDVEVLDPTCQELQGLPLVSWKRAMPKREHTLSESLAGGKGHCFGEIVEGKVRSVKPTYVQVVLEGGSVGSVHVSEVMEPANVRPGSFPTFTVKVGSTVTARVIGGREATSHRFLPFSHPKYTYTIPELSLIPSKVEQKEYKQPSPKEKRSRYKVGEDVTCFVSKFNAERKSLQITTDPSVTGVVELLSMITDPKDSSRIEKLYKQGQAVSAKVVEVSTKPQRLSLSFIGIHKLEVGSVSLGMVTNIHPQLGLQVKLPFGCSGSVGVTDLADAYKPYPLEAFKKEQLIRCFLLRNDENGKWQLSLRPSRVNPQQAKPVKDLEVSSFSELSAGQTIRGYVRSVGEQGVFITLSSGITGRAQFQQTSNYFVSSHQVLAKHLPPNTLLTTKILNLDKTKETVSLSLLPVDTGKPDVLPESLGLPLRLVGKEKLDYDTKKQKKRALSASESKPNEAPVSKKRKKQKTKGEDSDSGVEVYFREEEDKAEEDKTKADAIKQPLPSEAAPSRLQVAAGFSWDTGLSSLKPTSAEKDADSSDGEDEEGSSKPQKKTRHELEQERKAAEKALVQREAELMDPSLRPQDAAAFERLLLASPNSSLVWLQYMAHHLQATEIEQARAVAERALKTISFREEQEKLNVWVALLNLENMYGTQDSLKKVFERALQFCEPMPVYQQLADIYAKSDKIKEAENLYKSMVKRFRDNKAVWLSYGTFLLQQGKSDAASALLQRALTSLPAKETVDIITKFAQLEFRYGDSERGRAMFDKVLTSYPKRTDLWSVFIDLMVKHGSQTEIRALFDRVIHLSVSVKKIKFFFKRYLDYEKKYGTPQSIQAVKEKAVEFVESKGMETDS